MPAKRKEEKRGHVHKLLKLMKSGTRSLRGRKAIFSPVFFFALAVLFFFAADVPVFADTKYTDADLLSNSPLVSSEGQHKTLDAQQSADAKNTVKKPAAYQLPDPDPDDEKAEGVMKSVEGAITGKSNSGFAVEYEKDETKGVSNEIWVTFNSKLRLNGVKSVKELERGDTVRIIYKETKAGRHLLKGITLLEKKPKEDAKP